MTCIAAVADGGRVVMGGDSCYSYGDSFGVGLQPKVFRRGGLLLGVCGSLRIADVLRFNLPAEAVRPSRDVDRFLRVTFVDSVRRVTRRLGAQHRENGTETQGGGGDFLVGVAGRLFLVTGDFGVIESDPSGLATGSGELPARGALFALRGRRISPKARVLAALQAAESCVSSVRGPFVVEEL